MRASFLIIIKKTKPMKKLLIATTLIGSLLSSAAIADNRHSLSIEASKIDVEQSFGSADYLGSDDSILPTLRYGYKFQLNDFYLRPSVSYTFGDIEMKDTDRPNDSSTLSQILTLEGDAGYNITEKLGVFVTLGLMKANFERDVPSGNYKDDANGNGALVGVGVEYDIMDSLSVGVKYQHAQIDYGVQNNSNDFEVEVDTIKVGLSYNF